MTMARIASNSSASWYRDVSSTPHTTMLPIDVVATLSVLPRHSLWASRAISSGSRRGMTLVE
jgi:hypothetical protein